MEQVAASEQGQSPPKSGHRRRRVHRLNKLLRPRPRQPMRAFSLFLQERLNRRRTEGDKNVTRVIFRQAGDNWNALPAAEKERYGELCRGSWDIYREAVQTWNQEKQALKKPPPPYAAFLREVWEEERKSEHPPRTFLQMSKHVADLWNHKSYKRRYEEENKDYQEKIRRLVEEKKKAADDVQSSDDQPEAELIDNMVTDNDVEVEIEMQMQLEQDGEETECDGDDEVQGECGESSPASYEKEFNADDMLGGGEE